MRLPRLPDEPDARSLWRVNQLYWACIAVLALWLLLRTTGVFTAPAFHPLGFALVLLLAAANLLLRTLAALRRSRDAPTDVRLGWLFTLGDLLLIAAGLRLSGGFYSPLWIVLFVVVIAETLLSPPGEAIQVRWAAGITLLAGTWAPGLSPLPYLLDLAIRLFFLVAVSAITRRLRRNAADKEAELANLRAELAAASERTRLSREIHDGVGNALASAVLRLEVAARVARKTPETTTTTDTISPMLRDEAQALRETMDAVRDWTFFTRPWPTREEQTSPADTLTREMMRWSQRTGLSVRLEGESVLNDLPAETRVAVLRITQEALTNVAKYASARQASVVLRRDGRTTCLEIRDDGRGFDPETAGAGIGLNSMRERAEALGGTWRVESAPDRGTRIVVCLPPG